MRLRKIIAVCATALISTAAIAQPSEPANTCENSDILRQVDSLKNLFQTQGFTVVKESPMSMESEYDMPVIVPLREGTWYRVVFLGDITSKLYELRMYDWNEKQVAYERKQWGDVDGNVISKDYIPRSSEYHLIRPVQVNKKKKAVCGYIMLLKMTKASGDKVVG